MEADLGVKLKAILYWSFAVLCAGREKYGLVVGEERGRPR